MDTRPSPVETIKPSLFNEMMVPGALLAPPSLEMALASQSLMRWSPQKREAAWRWGKRADFLRNGVR